MSAPLLALVLAAGEGTRMKSKTPKVLHEVLGRPLLGHVLHAVSSLSPTNVCVVTGAGREAVEGWLTAKHPQVLTTVQAERKGTGHATRIALQDLAKRGVAATSAVIVLTGDTPLLTSETLQALLAEHYASSSSATVLTAEMSDASGYGRVVRDTQGAVSRIVEHKDANETELAIKEINSGIYIFETTALLDALSKLTTNNSQGEEYLTEVLEIQIKAGKKVSAFVAPLETEIMGVNDRLQLSVAATILQGRINQAWMHAGVTIEDSATTWIGAEVVIASDVLIRSNTHLEGATAIASDAVIGPDTTLVDSAVMHRARVIKSHVIESVIGESANVGPFSFLRPGSQLGAHSKAGAFVEIKNSIVGAGSKVPHLSYVGDAEIGTNSNIGAATIFVNYDGVTKHRTVIGNEVRIGSDTMLIAPVEIGDGAYTAAGSVITENVPAGSLGLARAKQSNILGWVLQKRSDSAAATAAKKALEENDSTTEMEKP